MRGIAATVAAGFVGLAAQKTVEGIRVTRTLAADTMHIRFEDDKHWTVIEQDIEYFQKKIFDALKVPRKYIVGTKC